MVFSMQRKIDWSVSNFGITILKSSYDMKKWKKYIFLNLRQVTNFDTTWKKVNLCHTYCNSPVKVRKAAKDNFVRTALRKFGAMYGCIWKSSTTYRNCCIIYLKSKKLHKHYIYSERWLINKAEMLWHLFCLFVPSFHYCCWFF